MRGKLENTASLIQIVVDGKYLVTFLVHKRFYIWDPSYVYIYVFTWQINVIIYFAAINAILYFIYSVNIYINYHLRMTCWLVIAIYCFAILIVIYCKVLSMHLVTSNSRTKELRWIAVFTFGSNYMWCVLKQFGWRLLNLG